MNTWSKLRSVTDVVETTTYHGIAAIFGSTNFAMSIERAFLVRPHQPQVTRDIGGDDLGEPAANLAHVPSPAAHMGSFAGSVRYDRAAARDHISSRGKSSRGKIARRERVAEVAMKFTRITVDPRQMGGMPCIRGLRIPVATIVGMVADGMAETEILAAYPDLQREDIPEALRYAADAVRERELPLTVP